MRGAGRRTGYLRMVSYIRRFPGRLILAPVVWSRLAGGGGYVSIERFWTLGTVWRDSLLL
jgi:hypothetical protein